MDDVNPDPRLAVTLSTEDDAVERLGLSPHERLTCPLHRRWLHHCVSSPVHAIQVTGHRWCRRCDTRIDVVLDELSGSISFTCPRCRRFPASAANHQILRSCRASINAARRDRIPSRDVLAGQYAA